MLKVERNIIHSAVLLCECLNSLFKMKRLPSEWHVYIFINTDFRLKKIYAVYFLPGGLTFSSLHKTSYQSYLRLDACRGPCSYLLYSLQNKWAISETRLHYCITNAPINNTEYCIKRLRISDNFILQVNFFPFTEILFDRFISLLFTP